MANIRRKTFSVGTMLHRVNHFLATSTSTVLERQTLIAFIENILHETGNYLGFRYISDLHGEVDITRTRRFYYVSEKIRCDYEEAAEITARHFRQMAE
jgi:hypothetical protein